MVPARPDHGAERGEKGEAGDPEPIRPFAPHAGFVDQGLADIEDDEPDRHRVSPS
jgi:hypothetical protein